MYTHVDDIDLYVGGLLEKAELADSILGPVFRCIVARQFVVLKRGDRFFYDLNIKENEKAAFTISMLNEVRAADGRYNTTTNFMIHLIQKRPYGLMAAIHGHFDIIMYYTKFLHFCINDLVR